MNKYFNSPSYIHYSYYGIREDKHKIGNNIKDINSNEICYCNPKNTELDKLILCFSYLLTDCSKCVIDYGDDNENEFDYNTESTYQECKLLIKQNPDLVFTKNNFGLYPIEFVDLLDQTFLSCYESYDNINGFAKKSFNYVCKIRNDLEKSAAFQYIIKSNHIGCNSNEYQLPIEIWEHIFTFI